MALEELFQSILGRQPTKPEKDYFHKFIDAGDLQEFEIGQILQAMPEYQSRLLDTLSGQYEKRLGASDQEVLGKATDLISGEFRRRGRPDSSGVAGAIATTGRDLARERQRLISAFYGGGLSDIRDLYQNYGQAALGGAYGLRNDRLNYERNLNLSNDFYTRQQNDFNNYLNAYNRRARGQALARGGLGLYGGVVGGGAGFALSGGNPLVALAAAKIGSEVFGSLGGLF